MFAIGYLQNGQYWYYSVERGAFATKKNPDGFTKFAWYMDARALMLELKSALRKRGDSPKDTDKLNIFYMGN